MNTGYSSEPFLQAKHICKQFGSAVVLDDVSLEMRPGELVAILGPSGCGKTTLLRIIAGLERQDSGLVSIDNRDLSTAPPAARGCGIVFQSYALFPNLSVEANIAFGMSRRTLSRAQRDAKVTELLELIGLRDIAKKYPARLSGGQQQRVALARALAINPSVLLLDEPLSALDAKVRARLRGEIREIQQRLQVTTILVTHDQEEALTMADRIVVMDGGRILQSGTPWEIYRHPNHALVADFVGSMNVLPGWTANEGQRLAMGELALSYQGRGAASGTTVCICFRPEDARLVPASDVPRDNCLPAKLQRVEFRGSSTRVYITVLDRPLIVDVPAAQVDWLLDAAKPQTLLQIPPEDIRLFMSHGVAI